ncbi:hypothetical protein B0T19DRAFT_472522 [Cercophora scortea]|uniref:Uncharacterized protein n=1 Tax=Cercophora scortea TaxID=314031 RepID=A0AAE0MM47_9PEZI|nr:hypothetical protein B0T19DRAFT_472522 [Cercophora scortea]
MTLNRQSFGKHQTNTTMPRYDLRKPTNNTMPTRSYYAYSPEKSRSPSPDINSPMGQALRLRRRLLYGEESDTAIEEQSTTSQDNDDDNNNNNNNNNNTQTWGPVVAMQAITRASARRGFFLNLICLPINMVVWLTIWFACVGTYCFVYLITAALLSDLDVSYGTRDSWWPLDYRPFWARRYSNLPPWTNELPMLIGIFVPCMMLRGAIEGGMLNEFL